MQKGRFTLVFMVCLLAVASFCVTQVQADPKVNIKFAVSGLQNFSGGIVLTIDGTDYDYYNLPTFQWKPQSTYTVVATTLLTGWDQTVYKFSSWTNGDGLTGASGTYTTPGSDTTVTANYVKASVKVTFATAGLSSCNAIVFQIDGTSYDYWNLPCFTWTTGTTHSVTAHTPITGIDNNIYQFSSWTNGDDLTGASGTYTTPDHDVTVTANYAKSTVTVKFLTSTLPTFTGGTALTIDGVAYDYYDLPSTSFIWETGTTHTVTASTPLTGWDGTVYQFSSWTNGNGLTAASGTFTVPSANVTVTANYASLTTLTIACNPSTIDRAATNTTTISGLLSSANSGVAAKTVSLSYFDGSQWLPIDSTTTLGDGTYTYNWNLPPSIANGQYAVKAEFSGDGNYLGSSATMGLGGGAGLMVLPEYAWGGLVALTACLAAAFLFFKARKTTKC